MIALDKTIWTTFTPLETHKNDWQLLALSRLGAQPRQANVSMQVTCPMQNGCIDYCNNYDTKRHPLWTKVSGLHWYVLLSWSSNLTFRLKTLSFEGLVQIQTDWIHVRVLQNVSAAMKSQHGYCTEFAYTRQHLSKHVAGSINPAMFAKC